MNTKIVSLAATICIVGCSALYATTSELRSPLNLLYRGGTAHYPLAHLDEERMWNVDVWGAGYCRNADRAYMPCHECECIKKERSTSHTENLAALFFGKESFRAEEAFGGGIILVPTGVPALSFARLFPQFEYSEKGVFLGVHVQREVYDSDWHFGGRLSLPVKVIDVKQRRACGLEVEGAGDGEEGLGDVIVRRQEFTDSDVLGSSNVLNNVNGYRLDFLSTLFLNGSPLVVYGNGLVDTTIAGFDITNFNPSQWPLQADALAYGLRANDGKITSAIQVAGNASATPANNLARNLGGLDSGSPDAGVVKLQADGNDASGNIDGYRLEFQHAPVDYSSGLALDRAKQGTIFIVPNSTGQGLLISEANAMQNAIDYAINQLLLGDENSATAFFRSHGIDLCKSDRSSGAGDLYAEWYTGVQKPEWFLDGLVGLQLPTGKKSCDVKRIYFQPTGNNGHVELRGGFDAGWHPIPRFSMRLFAAYAHVFDAIEMKAPAFAGATIRNLPVGNQVAAHTKWDYFLGNLDLSFYPNCADCGLSLGYEIYAKRNDKVCFCKSRATDFFGNEYDLDPCILAQDTDTITHKIRGEFFHRIDCCEYFIGASYILGGLYAMKETEFHAGVVVYF